MHVPSVVAARPYLVIQTARFRTFGSYAPSAVLKVNVIEIQLQQSASLSWPGNLKLRSLLASTAYNTDSCFVDDPALHLLLRALCLLPYKQA